MNLKKILALTLLSFSLQAETLVNKDGLETEKNFLINATKSFSERSGQIFAVPQKNNIVMGNYTLDGFSHINKNGKIVKLNNLGTGHGTPWDYDTHIPIVMYGEGFINTSKKVNTFATQQDITATYAEILKTTPPTDLDGKVLTEALKKTDKKPKAILTIVLDQVGMEYYKSHPNSYPEIKKIMDNGTFYTNAKVTHLESETAVGHVAIGTGAYPEKHGIPANSFWLNAMGRDNYSFMVDRIATPVLLKSPTLADVYDVATDNKAIIVSYCYAERASMGMAGHGAMYRNADKDLVLFYDDRNDLITTNKEYFSIPNYLENHKAKPYLEKFTNNTGIWMEHKIPFNEPYTKYGTTSTRKENKVTLTPIFSEYEKDMYVKIIENEPIGQDEITDLLYLNFKSTDSASHSFGFESEECKEVLESIDKQIGEVIRAFEKKVGKENIIVTITADHGSTPLVELSGGTRLDENELTDELNKKFDTLKNKVDVINNAGQVMIVIDEAELKRNNYTLKDIKNFLLTYKVQGKNFYKYVFTKDEILKFRYENEHK